MKRCCTCHEWRPLDWYSSARNRKDGLYPQCRACRKVSSRENYLRNYERIRERTKEYTNRPEVKKRIKARTKENYWNNREYHLAHAKQWLRDNKERRREYIRGWNERNANKVREYQQAYKARKRGATQTPFSEYAWWLMLETFRRKCVYCGKRLRKPEQDHVTALSKGGAHAVGNVVPACRKCNAGKCAGPPPLFWWKQAKLDAQQHSAVGVLD